MFKNLFIYFIFILILTDLGINTSRAQGSICKVTICNCCAESGTVYDIYEYNGTYVGGGTLGSGGCSTPANLTGGNVYYVVISCNLTSLPPVYFTACVCGGSEDTVKVPCCPSDDNKINLNTPENNIQPSTFKLFQNYPNPFNPVTKIQFNIPDNSYVKLTIYDVNGKEVETLVNGYNLAGNHEIFWDGKNVSSGVYFYKIEAGNYRDEKKMVLMK